MGTRGWSGGGGDDRPANRGGFLGRMGTQGSFT